MSKLLGGTYLKKTKHLNKAISKTENSFKISRATSSEETKLFTLPPIEKNLYQKAILQPTSVLTRYIEKHAQDFLKNTEEDMNRPILIKTISKNRKKKEGVEKKEDEEEEKENNNIKCMTDRGNKKNIGKFDKKLLYLTEIKNKKIWISSD